MRYKVREGLIKGQGRFWGNYAKQDWWGYSSGGANIYGEYIRAKEIADRLGGRVIRLLNAEEVKRKARAEALRLAANVMWARERTLLKKPKSKMSFIDVAVAQTYASCALINLYTAESIWPTVRGVHEKTVR